MLYHSVCLICYDKLDMKPTVCPATASLCFPHFFGLEVKIFLTSLLSVCSPVDGKDSNFIWTTSIMFDSFSILMELRNR